MVTGVSRWRVGDVATERTSGAKAENLGPATAGAEAVPRGCSRSPDCFNLLRERRVNIISEE